MTLVEPTSLSTGLRNRAINSNTNAVLTSTSSEDLSKDHVAFDLLDNTGAARDHDPRFQDYNAITAEQKSVEDTLDVSSSSRKRSVYLGSYAHSHQSLASGANTPKPVGNAYTTWHMDDLSKRLGLREPLLETYGIEEWRDGFFDASFSKPDEMCVTVTAIPRRNTIFSTKHFVGIQKSSLKKFIATFFRGRQRLPLLRSVLAYMIAYIICLIGPARHWLGPGNYFLPIATVVNHSGRTLGAQIEGTIACVFGAALGLAYGTLWLYISTCTSVVRDDYGALLATGLLLGLPPLSWCRARYVRLYQFYISTGIALFYVTVQDVSPFPLYRKNWNFGIPWVLGIALAFLINIAVFPDTGSYNITLALHRAILATVQGLESSRDVAPNDQDHLNLQMINLSEAVRDMSSEITISKMSSSTLITIRNQLQAIMRDLVMMEAKPVLFEGYNHTNQIIDDLGESKIDVDNRPSIPSITAFDNYPEVLQLVKDSLRAPAWNLAKNMREVLLAADRRLISYAGYTRSLPEHEVLSTLNQHYDNLKTSVIEFDKADSYVLDHSDLPPFKLHNELVNIFIFVHRLRRAARNVDTFVERVIHFTNDTEHKGRRLWLPTYPVSKLIYRSNPQVRHDRGGMTAGHFFRSKQELATLMTYQGANIDKLIRNYGDTVRIKPVKHKLEELADQEPIARDEDDNSSHRGWKYHTWKVLQECKGFEARFALRTTITTVLLSVPAWLDDSQDWWREWQGWWAPIIAWILLQPRVGGNIQDLISRIIVIVVSAVMGGLACAPEIGHGNPYVAGVIALFVVTPLFFRFTISSHPRSGLLGLLCFTIVSLSGLDTRHTFSPTFTAYSRGVVFLVATCAAVLINWFFWPFIARHELRKALSSMLLHIAFLYRNITARYVYHDLGYVPTDQDIALSELREGRIREGFLRTRELVEMTSHELRLRGPFNVQPYSNIIASAEQFFNLLVNLRQASLYFRITPNRHTATKMLSVRRDVVASILMDLWVLASGLRDKHPIPRYLPSAAIARQRLLMKLEESDMDGFEGSVPNKQRFGASAQPVFEAKERAEDADRFNKRKKRWNNIYEYAFMANMTNIVAELDNLQMCTKKVTGELKLGDIR